MVQSCLQILLQVIQKRLERMVETEGWKRTKSSSTYVLYNLFFFPTSGGSEC